jgi:hypothetical protein
VIKANLSDLWQGVWGGPGARRAYCNVKCHAVPVGDGNVAPLMATQDSDGMLATYCSQQVGHTPNFVRFLFHCLFDVWCCWCCCCPYHFTCEDTRVLARHHHFPSRTLAHTNARAHIRTAGVCMAMNNHSVLCQSQCGRKSQLLQLPVQVLWRWGQEHRTMELVCDARSGTYDDVRVCPSVQIDKIRVG